VRFATVSEEAAKGSSFLPETLPGGKKMPPDGLHPAARLVRD
jgi:hypothetical protein